MKIDKNIKAVAACGGDLLFVELAGGEVLQGDEEAVLLTDDGRLSPVLCVGSFASHMHNLQFFEKPRKITDEEYARVTAADRVEQ